jgi:hypothetical protein
MSRFAHLCKGLLTVKTNVLTFIKNALDRLKAGAYTRVSHAVIRNGADYASYSLQRMVCRKFPRA